MKKIINTKSVALACVLFAGASVLSCYDKFDPDSYNPPFTISGFSSVDEIKPANLVGYWPFDGTLTDEVAGLEGTATGTSFSTGFKGQALQGAMNGYALTNAVPGTAVTSMSSFTLSMWVNTPPPSTGVITVFSLSNTTKFWGNIEVFFENGSSNTNGQLRTHIFNGTGDNTFASNGLLNLFNTWVNLTITYDGATGTHRVYTNGSLVSTTVNATVGPLDVTDAGKIVFGTTQFNTTPSQTSGATAQGWASFLTGQLDEVRLYNTVLTTTEVQALVILQGKGK